MKSNKQIITDTITTIPDHLAITPADPAGFAPLGGIPGGAAEPSSSMASPVTRHAQNPPAEHFQFLLCGLDSLDLGLFVQWDDNWEKTCQDLNTKKQAAQDKKPANDITDIGRDFLHLPNGKPPNYRYHLQFIEYHLYLAISKAPGISPNVYVSVSSSALWHEGVGKLLELIEFDIAHFGGTIVRVQPSRIDLCADFRLAAPLTFPFLKSHRVARSRSTNVYLEGADLETFYCGSPGAPLRLRIYDKGKEICKSNKQWFGALWNTDDFRSIWRVEYQIRRSVLHQYRIQELEGLRELLGSIWHYLTTEWFSLRLPDKDKAERRTIHPWWQAVQNCGELLGDQIGARRNYDHDHLQSIKEILPHVFGRMITIAALSGVRDRKESIHYLGELLYKYSDDDKFNEKYREKVIKLGYRGTLGGASDDDLPF